MNLYGPIRTMPQGAAEQASEEVRRLDQMMSNYLRTANSARSTAKPPPARFESPRELFRLLTTV